MYTDKDIVEGCKKGKRSLQDLLYERYAGTLLGVSMRYIGNKMEAEDVLHDAFIKIYLKIGSFKLTEKGSLLAWMRRIVVNTSLNQLRDKNKISFDRIGKVEFEDEGEYAKNDNTEIINIEPEELLKIIQNLPKGYNVVFNLYVFEKFSHQEIAEKLEISINTSKTQLMKARAYIRKKITEISNVTVLITA